MKKLGVTILAVATMSMGSLVTGPTAGADDRGPAGPGGVVGPVGANPVVGPAGPVGVGGVVGPVGVDPVVDAAVPNYYYVPFFPGEIPCYTPEGVAYFTPPGEPCY